MAPEPASTRVAVDVTALAGPRTGVGVFVAGAVGALAGRPDVDLVAYGMTLRGRRELPAAVPPGVVLRRWPMPAGPLMRAWAVSDLPRGEWWTGPVDVVHGTNFVVPPARAARLVTVHDLTPLRYPQLCSPTSLRYPGLVRRALATGAAVHAHSHWVAAEVVEMLGARPEQVHVVPLGIDVPTGGPPASPASPPYLLGLGTVEPRKDFPSLVSAFDRVAASRPDLQLHIAGPAGWGEGDLTRAVAAARHGDRVRRLGWVADRAALLRGATALVYPSVYEGFGFPPLEAMAAGVPVVATAAGAIPEVVGDAALLVAPGDADALADAVATVLDDGATRDSLVDAGRRRAALFTWQATADGLAALYAKLAG